MERNKLVLRIDKNNLPVFVLLFVPCFKWFFEGILGNTLLEIIILSIPLIIYFLKRGGRFDRFSGIWIFYVGSIILSVLFHVHTTRIIYGACYVTVVVFYMFFCNTEISSFKFGIKFLAFMAAINGIFVVVQFLFTDSFDSFYFKFLGEAALDSATKYLKQGNYYGFFYTPADPAGLICFVIAAIFIWLSVSVRGRKGNKKILFLAVCILLLFPLLLTGKRGVLICSVIALVLVLIVLYSSRKQAFRILGIMLFLIIGFYLFRWYTLNHSDNVFLNRFSQFFTNLANGDEADSGRSVLYAYAIDLWSRNKLFGIGWRHFRDLTTTVYGYVRAHEVNCDYLQFLCETGLVGTVLILIPIITMLRRTLIICTKVVRKINDSEEKWIVLFGIFIQFFTLFYACIEIPFYDMVFFNIYIFSCMIINYEYKIYNRGALVQ